MSEAVSLEFVLLRLDGMQNDVNDVRRRMIALGERFTGMEQRFVGMEARFVSMEARFAALEARFTVMEERIDHLANRTGRLEETAARTLLLVERIAKVQGIEPLG